MRDYLSVQAPESATTLLFTEFVVIHNFSSKLLLEMNLSCFFNSSFAVPKHVTLYTGFELAVRESRFADWIFLFTDHFKQFFRETTKFLFTLQAWQITYILLQKVLNYTLFSCIWIPSNCWNFSLNLRGSLLKR